MQDKQFLITETEIEKENIKEILGADEIKGFLKLLEIVYFKCNHRFLILFFVSENGLEIKILNNNNEFCDYCDYEIKELSNIMFLTLLNEIENKN